MRYFASLLLVLLSATFGKAQEIDPSVPLTIDSSVVLRTYVAGLKHHISRKQYEALQIGETLILKAEPENKYDRNAIAIYKDGNKIGFLPAQEAASLGETLAASPLIAVITKKDNSENESAMSISISVRRE